MIRTTYPKPTNAGAKNKVALLGDLDRLKKEALLRQEEQKDLIAELRKAVESYDMASWEVADLALELSDRLKLSTRIIAKNVGRYSHQFYADRINVAKTFPSDARTDGVEYDIYAAAYRANTPRNKSARSEWSEIADAIREMHKSNKELTTRAITNHIHQKRADDVAARKQDEWDTLGKVVTGELFDNIHNSPWEDVAAMLPSESLDAVYSDPMFVFRRRGKWATICTTNASTKSMSQVYGANSVATAMLGTLRLFRVLRDKMKSPHCPLYLHQYGGYRDLEQVTEWAEKYGWYEHTPMVWVYSNCEGQIVGSKAEAGKAHLVSGSACQRIRIFTQSSDDLLIVGTAKSNSNILVYPMASRMGAHAVATGKAARREHHNCEHAPELAADILGRTLPSDSEATVFETHACSAPAAVACVRNGWHFVSCEAYADNWELGRRRIELARRSSRSD